MTATFPLESHTRTVGGLRDDTTGYWIDGVRHVFVWPEKPPTMNQWNLMHHRVRAQHRAAWREPFRLMSEGCVPLAWCNVTVDHLLATRRNVDVGACMPAVKAAIDGVVLGGVLADDNATLVRRVTFNAPTFVGYDALILTLDGPPVEVAA